MNEDVAELIAAIERAKRTPFRSDRVFPSADSQAAALRGAETLLRERDDLADALARTLREKYEAGLVSMEPSPDPARCGRSDD